MRVDPRFSYFRATRGFFVKSIIKWHKEHMRIFPWRKGRNPYRVLVAELMLQRTRANQVAEIYGIFIRRFPNVDTVVRASADELRAVLSPLGLHHRIPRFIELFRKISADYKGKIPSDLKELLKLPGIGKYVASAVLCFGFDKKVPIVDVNVVRVLSRFFGIRSTKKRPHTDTIFWQYASELIKNGNAKKVNEALLDFASLICQRVPRCNECPVNSMCLFFNETQSPYSHSKPGRNSQT
jgi:A/G-specific adenine glycosylase